jgi:hypothetical protein
MLFRSRATPTLWQRLRVALWPRRSWLRSIRYIWLRLFRLKASPHRIGVGVAAGVFASITPLIGVQMLMAGAITILLRGNVAAAMLATFVGNPMTWPVIWAVTYAVGAVVVGQTATAGPDGEGAQRHWQIAYTMLVGSIPVGLLAGVAAYRVTVRAVEVVRGVEDVPAEVVRPRRPPVVAPRWRLW